jgi:hypothetical protein
MKKLVFVLSVIVVIVGIGFFRGWFTVNPDKIQQDENRAKQEVRELLKEVKSKTDKPESQAKEPPRSPAAAD